MSRLPLLLVLMSLAAPAAAAEPSEAQKRAACEADAIRLCMSVIFDRPKAELCVYEHYRELSPACRKVVDETRQARELKVSPAKRRKS